MDTDVVRFERSKSGSSMKGGGESMEMASPVRSSQNLASSTSTRLERGNSPATASSSPSSSSPQPQTTSSSHPSHPRLRGSTARLPPSQSTSSSYQICRRRIEVGGTITRQGAFVFFVLVVLVFDELCTGAYKLLACFFESGQVLNLIQYVFVVFGFLDVD